MPASPLVIMTKSKFAFKCNLDAIFKDRKYAYMWTFTFPDLPDIDEAAQRWRHFVNWLVRYYQGKVFGVRVYELHQMHGIHIHALINLRLNVNFIRLHSTRYGFGRIHVKRVTRTGAGYLAKYLGKQGRTGWLKHKRLWTTFGRFDKARVKDIIVDSPFTRAIKFCQEELQRSRLPFWFVSALQYFPTSDPVRLKLACRAAQGGAYYADIIRILMSA